MQAGPTVQQVQDWFDTDKATQARKATASTIPKLRPGESWGHYRDRIILDCFAIATPHAARAGSGHRQPTSRCKAQNGQGGP